MDVAILVDIVKETDKNWRFIFESPLYPKLDFISGQLVQLVSKPGEDDSVVRNYSIASWADGTNKFELIVTYLPKGAMSEYLFKEAKIGDEFLYRGPMGLFVLPEILTRDVYFVSTGSGISPFRSMLGYIHKHKVPTGKIKLFFGTRYEEDLVYYDEMVKYHKEIPNFEYVPCLSRGEWSSDRVHKTPTGYVHPQYLKYIDSDLENKPLVYYCGWRGMIDDGRAKLAERGFEIGRDIKVEIFG